MIRFDEVEQLIHFDNPHLKNEKIISYTLGTDIGNLKKRMSVKWDISNEFLVTQHIPEILADIKEYAFPYLEKYSSLEKAAKEFYIENDFSKCLTLFPHERALRAVAFAYILQGNEFAKKIFNQKLEFLKGINTHQNDINRVIEIVKKNILL